MEHFLKTHPIPVAVSAHHVHLTQASVNRLFGENYTLAPRAPLSQPGQFAACETVTVDSYGRPVIFGEVIVRVSPDYRLEFHLDTDEGNAAGVGPGDLAHLMGREA
jgi:propanediol utilization protein